jgi:hypothetical protein
MLPIAAAVLGTPPTASTSRPPKGGGAVKQRAVKQHQPPPQPHQQRDHHANGRGDKKVAAERSFCWTEHAGINLENHETDESVEQRCGERYASLVAAQRACEAARAWCGGVTRDSGLQCGSQHLDFELRSAERTEAPLSASIVSWLMRRAPGKNATRGCEAAAIVGARRLPRGVPSADGLAWPAIRSGRNGGGRSSASPPVRQDENVLGALLAEKLAIANERMARGPPAFERFPEQAFRYRDWGGQTRHGRGDMYPLYTLDTLRNLADHLFDSSTGYATGPERARTIAPCSVLYSTLRPTSAFLQRVHAYVRVPYLLMTDTADDSITRYHGVQQLLQSPNLFHWWAVDNEVLDSPKLEGLPLGVMDALELGVRSNAHSVSFHANVSEYLSTLIRSQAQPKSEWLMMQMTETHAERRRVRSSFTAGWGDGDVRLTPEHSGKRRRTPPIYSNPTHALMPRPAPTTPSPLPPRVRPMIEKSHEPVVTLEPRAL